MNLLSKITENISTFTFFYCFYSTKGKRKERNDFFQYELVGVLKAFVGLLLVRTTTDVAYGAELSTVQTLAKRKEKKRKNNLLYKKFYFILPHDSNKFLIAVTS